MYINALLTLILDRAAVLTTVTAVISYSKSNIVDSPVDWEGLYR